MRRPLFLGRIPYRRRRLRDAARLLPVAGAFLMILPILWTPAGGDGNRLLSSDVIWFFVTWALLILAAALLAPGLASPDAPRPDAARPAMLTGDEEEG
ncbi:hypothetical protein [Gemmobacter sp. 24YEA27]|uniref:hypothetical protein n=1 Tax=Gemmobacter sp. 24YEA27 TaxID=3040672 RepID=UPI0024B355FC|nr:hypothetical protein [Gemmobacter sp. 24YEA27]